MVRNRWIAASLAAVLTLAAGCAGGSSTSSPVPAQPGSPVGNTSSRLTTTSAPSQRVSSIYTRNTVKRGSVQDPLANWVFVEPLAVDDSADFSVPSWVSQCASIDPIFGGLWYISWSDFSTPLSVVSLPGCTLPSTSSSDLAKYHGLTLTPGGNGNTYIVELDVGLFSLSATPIAGPALDSPNGQFVLASLQNSLTFQKFHLYAFFLAEYTGSGTPTAQSI